MRRLFEASVRRLLLIAISVVLMASLVGVCIAFTTPSKIKSEVPVLNYEHEGKFDYTAYVKPSYFFDDLPLEADRTEGLLSKPKYPIEMIDAIQISFSYFFEPDKPVAKISEQVEVKAIVDKGMEGREEIILVPLSPQQEAFTVHFSLDSDQIAPNSRITITASIYTTVEMDKGPIFERFSQSLVMQLDGPLIEIDTNLVNTRVASFGELGYEQTGEFQYSVRLKEESPYGAITLEPPSVESSTWQSQETLGTGETLFTSLMNSLDMSFSYHFECSTAVIQLAEEVEISAVLENPQVWSKTLVLVPLTEKNGDFTVTFPFDFDYFLDVFKTIEGETGTYGSRSVTIKADVHTVATTDSGSIDERFSQTLTTKLGGDILEFTEKLNDSKSGTIMTSGTLPNPKKLLGLPISTVRNLSAGVLSVSFILFVYLLVLNMPKPLSLDEQVQQARKRYKGLIVETAELPKAYAGDTVVTVGSLDELVKAADALLKPVLHRAEQGRHIYCVIDGATRYQCVLTSAK